MAEVLPSCAHPSCYRSNTSESVRLPPSCVADHDIISRSLECVDRILNCQQNILRRIKEILQRYILGVVQHRDEQQKIHVSLLALLMDAVRCSFYLSKVVKENGLMDIGCPTGVKHVTHVTFDKFDGFLGLPVELEVEVPSRVPSASASVFGVSAESMQCSHDKRGNSVPTILLLLQERLYGQGGLRAEGIFMKNPQNSQDREVRQQLNKGVVPHSLDIYYLAGLIKSWFRELPKGLLDCLDHEQVMQCFTKEQCIELMKQLPSTEAALLDWVINLMADVAQEEESNKMNAHNIAMVFAPHMTTMDDPSTALMHVVQVTNFLKTLILKTLRDREEAAFDPRPIYTCHEPPFDGDFDTDNSSPILVDDENDSLEDDAVQGALMAQSCNLHKLSSFDNVCFLDKLGKITDFNSDEAYVGIPIYQGVIIFFICLCSNKKIEGLKSGNSEFGHCPLVYPQNARDEARFHETRIDGQTLSKVIYKVQESFQHLDEELDLPVTSILDQPSFGDCNHVRGSKLCTGGVFSC